MDQNIDELVEFNDPGKDEQLGGQLFFHLPGYGDEQQKRDV